MTGIVSNHEGIIRVGGSYREGVLPKQNAGIWGKERRDPRRNASNH
jgi:hypothetical protein